jgi:hypothetical protein
MNKNSIQKMSCFVVGEADVLARILSRQATNADLTSWALQAIDMNSVATFAMAVGAGAVVNGNLIQKAANCSHARFLVAILRAKPSPDLWIDERTPLLHTVDGLRHARQLLFDGASPNISFQKRIPLHVLCRMEFVDVDVLRALLDAGADVGMRDGDGNTPLHHVCNVRNIAPVLKILVNAGANVHSVNKAGSTPLGHAISLERATRAVVCAFLHVGASVDT